MDTLSCLWEILLDELFNEWKVTLKDKYTFFFQFSTSLREGLNKKNIKKLYTELFKIKLGIILLLRIPLLGLFPKFCRFLIWKASLSLKHQKECEDVKITS